MAQKVTATGGNQPNVTVLTGVAARTAPPLPASGAGVASVYASAAPDGFIGWHPGPDVPRSSTAPVGQPVNTASL